MKTNSIAIAACLLASFFAACNSGIDQNNKKEASAPLQLNIPQSNAAPANSITTPPANATAALNPAHGQPGHNCDIAVGAPLNGSAAANPGASQAPFQTNAAPLMAAPQGTVRLNPAHGQPGHDCAVEVGKPLR